MEKSVQEILDLIQNNWEKRQSWFWRLKNKIVYKFIRRLYEKTVPKDIPDPEIDEKSEVFSFFAHPNMQLGLPNEDLATRVDDDGQIDTGYGKFIFFRGDPIQKVDKRIWTLSDGYLPEINYSIDKFNIKYSIRIFQYWLDESKKEHPINFIEVEAHNLIDETVNDDLYLGVLFNPFQHQVFGYDRPKFKKKWVYQFDDDNYPIRNGKILYFHGEEQPVNLFSKMQYDPTTNTYDPIPYEGQFRGINKDIKHDTIALVSQYRFHIGPKGLKRFIFKIPQQPINANDTDLLQKIKQTELNRTRRKFKDFWNSLLDQCTQIEVPESKVVHTSKASLIYNFMCQNYHNTEDFDEKEKKNANDEDKFNTLEQHVNRFQYNDFWIRDSSFFAKMYTLFDRPDISKKILLYFLNMQNKKGNFISQKGQMDGWGQTLWAFGEYMKYTKDKEFAEKVFEPVMDAIGFFEELIKDDDWGIIPPIFSADNEMISGRYTGHNLWAWCGLNNAQYIAEYLNRQEEAKQIEMIKSQFLASFIPILDLVADHHDKRIPPGLDTDLGEDWSNLLMLYPQLLLDKDDPKVKTTLNHYMANKMPERIATWMVFNHHYITERIGQQNIILDNQKAALRNFYGMLSHTGACHEGFEHNIKPWGNRHYLAPVKFLFWHMDYFNFPPHGWFAVCYNLLIRNMLIREENDILHLLSVLSPAWIKGPITIRNANTYFGVCNLTLTEKENDVVISFSSLFTRKLPDNIIVHIPYYIDKKSLQIQSDQNFELDQDKKAIIVPALKDFSLRIVWKIDDAHDLSYFSYEKAVDWLKNEYKKRYEKEHSK